MVRAWGKASAYAYDAADRRAIRRSAMGSAQIAVCRGHLESRGGANARTSNQRMKIFLHLWFSEFNKRAVHEDSPQDGLSLWHTESRDSIGQPWSLAERGWVLLR